MSDKRILVVEDEAIVQVHLRKVLTGLGYEVVDTVGSAADAIRVVEAQAPDLVLMDIRIEGDRDGIDTAHVLRDEFDVAVVFITAHADEHTVRRTEAVGALGYIVKPFTTDEVRAVLATALAAQERLRTTERRGRVFETALRTVREGVIVVDESGSVTFANPQALALVGLSERDTRGRYLNEIMREPDTNQSAIAVAIGRATKSGVPESFAARITRRDGGSIQVDGVVEPLYEEGGRIGVVINLRDSSQESRQDDIRSIGIVRKRVEQDAEFLGLIGKSDVMLEVYAQVKDVADVDWTVLVEGETGTGKELVARAIHSASTRRNERFVAVNCAGLTDSLLGSQLFGHRKGAFTDATADHVGVFEAANGGTLFLDEIGDISEGVQKTLLRVLEEKYVTRIGDSEPRRVDVRVVTATQRNLKRHVAEHHFRADLYFRLRVAHIRLPRLAERGGDIELLAKWFLAQSAEAVRKPARNFDPTVLQLMRNYPWPGNVRELKSAVESAVLAARGETVEISHLPEELRAEDTRPIASTEKERILQALERAKGNRSQAASLLGVSRSTLYRRMLELGIQ